MTAALVLVFGVAALAPVLAAVLRVPGPLLEIGVGIVLGPSLLGLVRPDATLDAFAIFGLSFLLFLAGHEVDLRRFRGVLGRRVAVSLLVSLVAAALVAGAMTVLGVRGGAVVGVALLATSLGLVVPVLADAGALERPFGRVAVAGASAGEVAAVVLLSVGLSGGDTPLAGRLLLLGLLLLAVLAVGLVVAGVGHSARLALLVARLADTSAQIRVRWTVLLVAALALAAQSLGFEAILGAFLAGMLVRTLDPEPERTHPRYPVKLEAIGYGLLVPVFFVTSGLRLDLAALTENPSGLVAVPAFLAALLLVRGLPVLALRGTLARRELVALGLLQATSLPFLVAATTIGREMGMLDAPTAASLVAAGLVSVLVFPAVAVGVLSRAGSAVPV